MNSNDWRNRGQEDYLKGVTLIRKKYKSSLPYDLPPGDDPRYYSDHEHCDFCFQKFMEGCNGDDSCSSEGYCTIDGKLWICDNCYNDLKHEFNWTIVTE